LFHLKRFLFCSDLLNDTTIKNASLAGGEMLDAEMEAEENLAIDGINDHNSDDEDDHDVVGNIPAHGGPGFGFGPGAGQPPVLPGWGRGGGFPPGGQPGFGGVGGFPGMGHGQPGWGIINSLSFLFCFFQLR
jgi:hypothetical protein